MRTVLIYRFAAGALAAALLLPAPGFGWGSEGHRLINRLAATSLPADVPAFMHSEAAIDEIEYLGPEPDRWRSRAEPELSATQAPEHFIDLEPADALGPLPHNRLDFEAAVFAHNQRPEKIGLQPWETLEVWQRLKAALRDYRQLSAAKPVNQKDLRSVEQAAIFYAGWLSIPPSTTTAGRSKTIQKASAPPMASTGASKAHSSQPTSPLPTRKRR
jgi:hypothetical protein